jgi:hypothetical protein
VAEAPPRIAKPAPTNAKVPWDERIERLYRSWLRRASAAEAGHRWMSAHMWRRYLTLAIPVIVLTTILGTSAFASLTSTKSGASVGVRVIVGCMSILAAALSSLQTFLRYGNRSEGHRLAALRYEALRRDMTRTLALPPHARANPESALREVQSNLTKYANQSPAISERRWRKLEEQFHLSKVPPDPEWTPETITIPEPGTPDPAPTT